MTAPFFPLDPFTPQRLPLRQMAGELLPAALILRHYHSLKKQEYSRRLPNFHELEKQLRLPQMFLAGGLAALLAGNYLQGPRPQWPHRLGYARLFSLWANYLILADAASDQKELGPEASREFLRQCLVEIFQPVFEGHSRVREVAADLVSRHFDSPWLLTGGGREAPRSPLGSAALRLARMPHPWTHPESPPPRALPVAGCHRPLGCCPTLALRATAPGTIAARSPPT